MLKDMDEGKRDERIAKYLRGQLSPDELADFEEHLLETPEFIEEIRVTALIVESLERKRPSRLRSYALAASVLLVALVGWWLGSSLGLFEGAPTVKSGESIALSLDVATMPYYQSIPYVELRPGQTRRLIVGNPRERTSIDVTTGAEDHGRVPFSAVIATHSDGSVRRENVSGSLEVGKPQHFPVGDPQKPNSVVRVTWLDEEGPGRSI